MYHDIYFFFILNMLILWPRPVNFILLLINKCLQSAHDLTNAFAGCPVDLADCASALYSTSRSLSLKYRLAVQCAHFLLASGVLPSK